MSMAKGFLRLTLAMCVAPAALSSQPSAPRLAITREVRIDGNTNDLVAMGAILVLSNGTIVVDQDEDGTVRYFSREGTPLRTFGGKGDGPGEFRRVRYIGLTGDSVWAYDVSQERITHITPDYKVARTMSISSVEPGPAFASTLPRFPFVYIKAAYPGGTYLVSADPGVGTPRPASYPSDRSPWLRINTDAVVQSVVTWKRANPSALNVIVGAGVYGSAVPFKQSDLEDVADDGSRFAYANATVRGTSGGTFHVTMFGARGDTIYSRDYPFTGIPIPRRTADSAWDAAVKRAMERPPQVVAALRAAGPVPPVYPPLLSITVGRDGSAWIRMRQPGLSTQERFWLVLDAKGEPYASLVVPATLSVVTTDLSNIWGFERDADDVQSIVRYRISGRAGR